MTRKDDISDDALEALFAEAAEPAPLPDALRARILTDAEAVQGSVRSVVQVQRPSLVQRFFDAIGGWGGLSGLAVAAAAGVWIGFANPTLVSPDAADLDSFDVATEDVFGGVLPGDTLFFEEG